MTTTPSGVWADWHGGHSYAPGYVESVERFESIREALDAATQRYRVGYTFPQLFQYVNQPETRTLTPCVDESSEMRLFWAYPGHDLSQPDAIAEFNHTDDAFRIPGHNMWGTPIGDVGEGFCLECEHARPHHYGSCPRAV